MCAQQVARIMGRSALPTCRNLGTMLSSTARCGQRLSQLAPTTQPFTLASTSSSTPGLGNAASRRAFATNARSYRANQRSDTLAYAADAAEAAADISMRARAGVGASRNRRSALAMVLPYTRTPGVMGTLGRRFKSTSVVVEESESKAAQQGVNKIQVCMLALCACACV